MALSEVNKLAVITCLAVLGTALVCVISAYIFTCAYVSRSLRSLKDSPPKAENSSTPDQHPEIPLFDLWMPQPSALHAREHELLTQVPRWDIEEEFSMVRFCRLNSPLTGSNSLGKKKNGLANPTMVNKP
jgi:hypothetical protein